MSILLRFTKSYKCKALQGAGLHLQGQDPIKKINAVEQPGHGISRDILEQIFAYVNITYESLVKDC